MGTSGHTHRVTGDADFALQSSDAWFDEIDLEVGRTHLAMGTRSLGVQPWLVADERRADELALRAELLDARRAEVLVTGDSEAAAAAAELLALVSSAVTEALGDDVFGDEVLADEADAAVAPPGRSMPPLERAARLVQEDLCLLRRRDGDDGPGWYLDAAALCFPSRWRLADKIGHRLDLVHGPVVGYSPELESRVESLLDSLRDRAVAGERARPVRRRNWFVHPDAALFQPTRPPGGDPVVDAEAAAAHLVVRSERQTLRGLPETGWIVFTIRIQQATLGAFLASPDRRAAFRRLLAKADPGALAHRGMGPAQVAALNEALVAGWS